MIRFYSALFVILIILLFPMLQKRSNRSKTIEHLIAINDPLIRMFKESELHPIKETNAYHSPDLSETDEESHVNKRKLVTKDLEWRSSTVRLINVNRIYYSGIN